MKVLTRYLASQIYVATGGVLVAFLGLFGFFDLLNELDSVGKDGYQMHHALVYVLLLVPGRVYELLPIAVLIGSLYALTTLARNSEITVMRASGLSTARALGVLAATCARSSPIRPAARSPGTCGSSRWPSSCS